MAKRSQRPGRVGRPRQFSRGTPAARRSPQGAPTAPATKPSVREAPAVAPAAKTPAAKVDFAKEYRYVVQDLRRLFILAVVLMALLVTLAYFLT